MRRWLARIADSAVFGLLMFSFTMGVAIAIIVLAHDAGERADLERRNRHRVNVEKQLGHIERKLDTILIEEYHYRIEKGYEAPTLVPSSSSGWTNTTDL